MMLQIVKYKVSLFIVICIAALTIFIVHGMVIANKQEENEKIEALTIKVKGHERRLKAIEECLGCFLCPKVINEGG